MSEERDLPPARSEAAAADGPVVQRVVRLRQVRGRVASVRPIEGVATAVAAFVGLAEVGPFNRPILVTSWAQFTQTFGGFLKGTYLARAVQAFLNNGGRACFVVRIGFGPHLADSVERVPLNRGIDEPAAPESALGKEDSAPPDVGPATEQIDVVDDPADHIGLEALEEIDEVTIVCVPDLMTAFQNGWIDGEVLASVQLAIIEHCELMGDRAAILDPPPGLSASEVREWRRRVGYDSKFATLYWPWVKTVDPSTRTHNFMPPSGHVAGAWSRNDATRGVHKAPANELVNGVLDVEQSAASEMQGELADGGVNVIRPLPGKGIRISSARTLSSDSPWHNVNVRRLVNYLEKSILNGTDWVANEPRDWQLWGKIERTVAGFLAMESRSGVLLSGAPSPVSFFVKCDSETNSLGAEATGEVICEIGVAPVKPNEFLVFQLSHLADGVSTVMESL